MPRKTGTKRGTGGASAGRRASRGSSTRKRSPRSYSELGRLGGEAVKRSQGRAFFSRIGRKGGKKGGEARKRQLQGG
jgi:general stress protein YciG